MHAALVVLAVPLLALTPPWSWPVDPPHAVVRPYEPPPTAYSAGHRGIDLAAPGGTVYAPADGIVHFAGTVVDRPVLSLEHADGVLTSYEPVVTALAAGDAVARGQPIGTVRAGHCPGAPCLHFGVRVGGKYASPLLWLGGIERAVLLPGAASRVSAGAPAHERGSRIRNNPRVPVDGRSPLLGRGVVTPRSRSQ